MTIPVWPAINSMASMDNYQLTLSTGGSIASTDMDDGESRDRLRFADIIAPLQMEIEMTSAEIAIFKAFFKNDIKGGSFWFYMPIFDGTLYAQNLVKMAKANMPVITPLGYDNYNVALNLLVRNLTISTPPTTATATTASGTAATKP